MELFKTITLILVGCVILLLLVPRNGNAQTINFGNIIDVSKGSESDKTFKAEALFQAVIDIYDFSDLYLGRNYYSTLCGLNTVTEVQKIELEKASSFGVSKQKRKSQVSDFLIRTKAEINRLSQVPTNQGQTNLYRTLTTIVNEFDPEADVKHLIIYSDFCENSSAGNFSVYIHQPSLIMDDYENIIKKFSQDHALPNLKGFKIVLITPGTNDFHLWLSRFWQKFLMSRGAEEVNVRAAL